MFSSLIAFVFIFVARWCRSRSPSSQLFVTTSTPCGLHQQCFIILQWAEALRTISPCITCHWGSSVCLRICDTHHMRLPQVNEFWIFCGTSWCCKRVQSPNDVMQRFSFDLEKWFRQVFVIFLSANGWKDQNMDSSFPRQSCCSMTSKRSIDWFLESSRAWSFFTWAFA